MTAKCGGGTSSAKAEFGSTVAFTASGLAAMMNNIPTVWAVPLAGYLGTITYELATFCADDPPAIPTITAGDVAALFTVSDPVGHLLALTKFQDLVAAFAWCNLCKCDNLVTPTCGPAPAAPTGLPQVNPPIATGVGPTPTPFLCIDAGEHTFTTTTSFPVEMTPRYFMPVDAYITIDAWNTHTGAQDIQFSAGYFSADAQTGGNTTFQGVTASHNGDHATSNGNFYPQVLSTRQWVSLYYQGSVNFAGSTGHGQICFYNSSTQSPQPNCGCPPDPIVTSLLNNIQDLLTLLQRQGLPFAYEPGAVHSGLTGNGQLAVSQLLGVKVTPSAIPTSAGVTSGEPDELWLDSWLTWGNADGWAPREWLRTSPQLSLPANAQLYSVLGYSLRPGLTVDIQELSREP